MRGMRKGALDNRYDNRGLSDWVSGALVVLFLCLIPLYPALAVPLPGVSSEAQDACPEACPRAGAQAIETDYLFGVINDVGDPSHFVDEWARGVRATTLELQWKLYEPQEGVFDAAYVAHLKQILRGLKAQGWTVQLVPGYHYAPDWVFTNYPDMRYVNQYGESYDPDPFSQGDYRVINAPFNPQARQLIAHYIQQIFVDFDQSDIGLRFDSVRIGGGVQGELRYPPAEWGGRTNSYWAFDAHAQNPAVSGIPTATSGWRPGIDPNPGTVGRGQLIVNPGFEERYPNYPTLGWSPDDEVVAELVEEAHSGAYALRLSIGTPNRIHQYVRVEPGTVYHLAGWVRSADGLGRARIIISQYTSDGAPVAGAPFIKLESNATVWTEQSGLLTSAPTTRVFKVEMDGDRPGTYLFDDLRLRREAETDARDRDVAVPRAFFDWYAQKMTDFQNWQIAEIREYFTGQLDLVYAGKGLQRNQITDALTNDLRGDSWSERSRALYAAATHDRHVAGLADTHEIALYLTGIEEPAANVVEDASPYPGDWSAARWIAHLARDRGLKVWGENGGENDVTALAVSVQRMRANGFLGLLWGFESELYADPTVYGYATIDDYAALINYYSNLWSLYLPTVLRAR
jgi:hypothetical protein